MARILILEPQPEIRELFGLVASRLGHEVVTELAADGPQAPVDAILLEPDGAGSLASARSLHQLFPEIPIICASIVPPSRQLREELSPAAYLTKPFPLAELERALVLATPAQATGG